MYHRKQNLQHALNMGTDSTDFLAHIVLSVLLLNK